MNDYINIQDLISEEAQISNLDKDGKNNSTHKIRVHSPSPISAYRTLLIGRKYPRTFPMVALDVKAFTPLRNLDFTLIPSWDVPLDEDGKGTMELQFIIESPGVAAEDITLTFKNIMFFSRNDASEPSPVAIGEDVDLTGGVRCRGDAQQILDNGLQVTTTCASTNADAANQAYSISVKAPGISIMMPSVFRRP
jgi:hypothetical protein